MKKLLLVLSVSVCAAAAPIVRNPLPVDTGIEFHSLMETADFNGDGHEDILTIYSSIYGRVLSVVIPNGTGPFAAPVLTPIALDYYPYEVGIGDVNEDGRIDLVLMDMEHDTLGTFFGNGDGSFTPGPSFAPGTILLGSLTLGDFNGDHHLDVAVGTPEDPVTDDPVLVVHFGNGAGSFSGAVHSRLAGYTGSFQTADANADGKTDLIASSSIYLGDGNGGFVLKSTAVGGDVATGDFNRDGKLDLAIAATGTHDWYVQVWFGTGDGSLTAGAKYACGYSDGSIAAADVDGDTFLDLLQVASQSSMTLLRGKGDGTFHAPTTWATPPGSWGIAAGDFDRDGKADFVTTSQEDERLAFVRGNGDGTFRTAPMRHTGSVVPVRYPGLQSYGGIVADMNGDGKLDVVIGQDKPASVALPADVGVLLNDGTGRLGAPILTDTGVENGPLTVGDVNGDGKNDVVLIGSEVLSAQPRVLLGNGDGTFATPAPFSVNGSGGLFLAEFVGDSNLDLMVHTGHTATVYPGNGNGTFGTGVLTNVGTAVSVLPGDINGDGKMDWFGTATYFQAAFLNDGQGRFTQHLLHTNNIDAKVLADLNHDGKLDVVFGNYDGTETYLGNGDGTFAPAIYFTMRPVADWWSAGNAADFDGDGKLDIAIGTSIYLGNGDGRFRMRAHVAVNNVSCNLGDMDGNGSPDLVTLNRYTDDVTVFLTRTGDDPTATTSIALSSDQATAQYGRAVVLTATVTGGVVPLTGAVTFSVNGTPLAIIAVDGNGQASFTTAFATGSHNVTATYAGDENYLSSTKTITQSVVKAQPAVTISGGPNPRPFLQQVTIFVNVSSPYFSGFSPPAMSALTLRDGNTPLNLTITNGQARINTLTVGTHVISVDYPGDANYEPATASYTQTITKPVPSVFLQTTPAGQIIAGTPVTLRASLTTTSPTGTIAFYRGEILQATVPLVNGVAETQLTFPWGLHSLRAVYSGDEKWASSQASVVREVLIGPWGATPAIEVSGFDDGMLSLRWSKVGGAVMYTIWRRTTLLEGWSVFYTQSGSSPGLSSLATHGITWMFAVTATDTNGNVSPMSAPDLATTVGFVDPTVFNEVTPVKAVHVNEMRAAIAAVRTFAGLPTFSYTNTIATGQLIRATDFEEMRTALAQARATIGLPPIAFQDAPIVPSSTVMHAMHVGQLRAGTN